MGEYVETDLFIKFGQNINGGDLAIWKANNEVFAIETYDEMDISFFVAQNSGSFLDAFLISGIYQFDLDFETEAER